jgi:hypothetical protein
MEQILAMMDPGKYEDMKQTLGDVGPWPGRPNAREFDWRESAPSGTDLVGGAATGSALAGLFSGTTTPKMIASGRAGGVFKNRTTKVSQYVDQNISKDQDILDFGAGLHGIQTKKLREKGFNVTAFDLPENMQPGLHDPEALKKQYSTVMASNVLNVQPNRESISSLVDTLLDTTRSGGQVIANYPKSPRYGNLSSTDMLELLQTKANNIQQLKDLFIIKK